MADEAIVAVHLRNAFYRDNYRRVLLVLLLSILINVTFGGMLFYMYTHPPAPKYFATSINGRITPLVPLDQPNQSNSAVLQWATQAAIAAYNYNFVNYRGELQAASEFFTNTGWRDFLAALKQSNMLDAVKAKKFIVSAVAARAPVILQQSQFSGRYAWQIQMPLLITYQSASQVAQQRVMVTLLVLRVSTLNHPRGVGIHQFVASPM